MNKRGQGGAGKVFREIAATDEMNEIRPFDDPFGLEEVGLNHNTWIAAEELFGMR